MLLFTYCGISGDTVYTGVGVGLEEVLTLCPESLSSGSFILDSNHSCLNHSLPKTYYRYVAHGLLPLSEQLKSIVVIILKGKFRHYDKN